MRYLAFILCLLFAPPAFASCSGNDIYCGLVLWYTFDSNDISGTSATDKSGNSNTGTLENSPTSVAGVLGQALSFNGSSQYVSIPSSLTRLSGTYTISAWIKVGCVTSGCGYEGEQYITSDWSGSGRDYLLEQNLTQIRALVGNGSSSQDAEMAGGSLAVGNWYNIVLVVNSTAHAIYENGASVASQTGSYSGGTTANNRNIGDDFATVSPFDGSIDDVRIYNRALSTAEISTLYYLGISQHQNPPP